MQSGKLAFDVQTSTMPAMIQANDSQIRRAPGSIRDAILDFLSLRGSAADIEQIYRAVCELMGAEVPSSSVRSYLRLNTPGTFERTGRGLYRLNASVTLPLPLAVARFEPLPSKPAFTFGNCRLFEAECLNWLANQPANSIHAVVTDPPYGMLEYTAEEQAKLRNGKGGVWRIPPSYDGVKRSPLPRFTVLDAEDLRGMADFFRRWARLLIPTLVPGAHVCIATNPLLSYLVAGAVLEAGFERRGEVVRLVMTMRGGDRPKNAHEEFSEVSVMARSMYEPWLLFRKPCDGRVQDNLRKWKTGGLRRPSKDQPFGDVIRSAPTHPNEKKMANHPSLKPQAFLRQIVRAMLPLGEGIVCDTFAGSGSTLAAAEAIGYESIGVELDRQYVKLARQAIPKLSQFEPLRLLSPSS